MTLIIIRRSSGYLFPLFGKCGSQAVCVGSSHSRHEQSLFWREQSRWRSVNSEHYHCPIWIKILIKKKTLLYLRVNRNKAIYSFITLSFVQKLLVSENSLIAPKQNSQLSSDKKKSANLRKRLTIFFLSIWQVASSFQSGFCQELSRTVEEQNKLQQEKEKPAFKYILMKGVFCRYKEDVLGITWCAPTSFTWRAWHRGNKNWNAPESLSSSPLTETRPGIQR